MMPIKLVITVNCDLGAGESWGEVPQKYIYGQAVFRFRPFSQLGTID